MKGGDEVSGGGGASSTWSGFLARLRGRGPGQRRYVERGEIARGGMGIVLRVFDQDILRFLAMKVLRAPSRADASARDVDPMIGRFLEEAQITGQLDHPGIVPVHELGVDPEGRPFFTMKLVKGEDLRVVYAKLRGGDPEWNLTRVLHVLHRVCEAMTYAHDKGVIHRDLKPSNVMVGRYGETYVMDWGLARLLARHGDEPAPAVDADGTARGLHTVRRVATEATPDSPLVTMEGSAMGTPCFMAPEQAAGRLSDLGSWTDVYAVGAMLYELLAGHAPYQDDGDSSAPHDIVARVIHGPPEPIAKLARTAPPELIAICEKAMARAIPARYASMRELGDDLRAFLESRVVRAHATGPFAELKKWVARNRGFALLAAAAVLVVTALTGAFVQKIRAEKDSVLRLADMKKLLDLENEVDALWPADEAHIPAMRKWLERADQLLERREIHEETLADLRQRGPREGEEMQWWHDTLAELVAELDAFADDDVHDKTRAAIAARLDFAENIRARSIDQHRAQWDAAIADIADRRRSPLYGGLALIPQLGLVPLGRDPTSGLHEFAHLESGVPPLRDPATGKLALTEESGIVFVLLPGGAFTAGAQSDDPDAPCFDPAMRDAEAEVRQTILDPFFLSKFETTQAQAERLSGTNPSDYAAGNTFAGVTITRLHPLERLTWDDADLGMRRLALALPNPDQWEFACRGGTTTPWFSGAARESLRGHVNLADQSVARAGVKWSTVAEWPDLDDGYPLHAPVGSFAPNPFGLHDMLGNIGEWCADDDSGSFARMVRGGSFRDGPSGARATSQQWLNRDLDSDSVGFRAARALDR